MKTTKTFRLLAVLLALVLAFGAMPALAVEIDSSDYAAWTQSAVDDLYGQLMAAENYEDYIAIVETLSETARTAFFNALTEEQQAALEEHAIALTPASEPFEPIVRFTKVGPLLPAPASGARMMRAAARNGGSDKGIVLNKTAVKDGDSYKITLKAYATGKSTTTVSTEPVDIVLVLDVSGSMDEKMSEYKAVYALNKKNKYYIQQDGIYTEVKWKSYYEKWGYNSGFFGLEWNSVTPKTEENDTDPNHVQFYELHQSSTTKLETLKTAVNSFIDKVEATKAGSRIAIVKYAGKKRDKVGNEYYNGGQYNYSQIVTDNFVTTSSSTISQTEAVNSLKAKVNQLIAGGATQANYGMEHAKTLIDLANSDFKERKKVVIMFTDGEPTSGSTFENNVANGAISASKSIKDADATVYTIGVFGGANGTPVSSWDDVSQTNKYMHLVSSNYKNATSMMNTGDATYPDGGKSYFLSAGSAGELNSIFTQISQQVGGSTSQLDATSVIKDVVTPYFDMPEKATVNLYTAESDGSYDDWKEPVNFNGTVTIDKETRTVSVTGFNFKDNWCGNETTNGATTFHNGKKLIIEFTVKPKDGFLGGNGVPTNDSAGVYENANAEKPVASATVDPVDVQIKDVVITPLDTNVYLGAKYGAIVSGSEIKNNMTLTIGGVEVDLTKPAPNYGLADWQKKYVNIEVKITDINGQEVQYFEMLDDQQYKVTVTVTPKNEGTQTAQTGKDEGTIHVFTPELIFMDGTVDYMSSINNTAYTSNGDSKSYAADNYDSNKTQWIHIDETTNEKKVAGSEDVKMLGDQPNLFLSYEPTRGVENSKVTATDYVLVKVTVQLNDANGTDVTNKTTFVHKCDVKPESTCEWAQVGSITGNPAFLLHVKDVYADLTIKKSGANAVDENQSFLFTVTGPDNYSTEVIIVGNGSVTLKNLKIGTYTVTENTSWSWRYTPTTDKPQTITLEANGTNTVAINNTREKDQWLDGNVRTDNKFTGAAATTN